MSMFLEIHIEVCSGTMTISEICLKILIGQKEGGKGEMSVAKSRLIIRLR